MLATLSDLQTNQVLSCPSAFTGGIIQAQNTPLHPLTQFPVHRSELHWLASCSPSSVSVRAWVLSHVWHFVTPIDYSPLGSSVHGILQARILEWVAISFSRGSSRPRDQTHISYMSPALAGGFFIRSTTWDPQFLYPRVNLRKAAGV